MVNKPLTLSIVIPAYNEERYLKACLDSVARQNRPPAEVIVIDNNSTDKTAQIARDYKFVKLIDEPRQGVFFAVRSGFKAARSDILGRIDADTVLPPDWVSHALKDMQKPQLQATTGPVSYYDMPFAGSNYWFDHLMRKYTFNWSHHSPFLYGSNMAIRRSCWQKMAPGLCDRPDLHEDIDLAIHMYKAHQKISYSSQLLAKASGRRYNDKATDFIKYMLMYRRTYHSHGLYSLAIYPAMFMWSLGYILVHPWIGLWYSWYGRFNNQYPYSREARKNPMSSY